jgi:hypothetical protein
LNDGWGNALGTDIGFAEVLLVHYAFHTITFD